MSKIISTIVLMITLLAMFASCSSGGNVDEPNGDISAMDSSNNMTSSAVSSNISSNPASSNGGIISGTESVISKVESGINSMT
ncbi:MAG: hypothetical protein II257_02870 [Clostridia bacterium]|nr:hypothetical protein [Clostridia bacterium]MBQ2388882.1 hypothetical protein [Clostridia bacterium]MBQ5716569.1 hypothetical protein [Clostridia bacterium]